MLIISPAEVNQYLSDAVRNASMACHHLVS